MASSRLRIWPQVLGLGALAGAMLISGCATYYEDLMSPRELISASCQDLATEEAKVESNIQASHEGEGINIFAAAAVAFVEGSAGTYDANSSVSTNMAEGASSSSQLVADFTEKKRLISQLRMKRGCT